MDLTQTFKAAVLAKKVHLKTKLTQHKEEVKEAVQGKQTKSVVSQQSKKVTKQRDEFSKQAREVCHKITTLRNFLEENRVAYMRIGEHLRSSTQMTDEQRDLIDRESEKFFMHYTNYLAGMRSDWLDGTIKSQQQQLHMEAVCDLLCAYLRDVQNFYLLQKKHRIQYELDTYRMLKLAPDKKEIPEVLGQPFTASYSSSSSADSGAESDTDTSLLLPKERRAQIVDVTTSPQLRHRFKHKKRTNELLVDNEVGQRVDVASKQLAVDTDLQMSVEDQGIDGLSAEDIQMYEQENENLFQELQGVSHELEIIEKNVVEVAQLQDILTENVSLQNYNIERIVNAVVGATENVKDANEQIKQAIQRNAGLRVWSLFFLLVMSFALLFLDWYYD